MEQILYQYNQHWENNFSKNKYFKRPFIFNELVEQINNKQVIFISGLRRIGKTSLMKMLINFLIENITSANKVFYVSLDNYLLQNNSLPEIIKKYRQIHNLKHNEFIYLFFDEITYIKDYEIQLKNLYDFGYCKIFASSSNASLLKNKKAFLTGRNRIIEVLPLDYKEYLHFKNIIIKKSDDHLHEKYFLDFLKTGGIPEYVLTNDIAYLQELVDDIIFKDIVAQHKLRNPKILKDFFLLLMERSGKQFSINKMASILKISTETAKRYLEYFAETYLIYLTERHGKTNERILSPKKIYSSDIGIKNLFTGFRDIGAVFENYIFLKIKHLKPKYLYENQTEIDFITENKKLIEVKFKNAELNKKQQILFNNFNAKNKYIIKNNEDIENLLKN